MRIGIFTDSYLPIKYGMETSIESFRLSLERLGHEVYIYAPQFPNYQDKNPRVFRFKSFQPSKMADMRLSFPFAVGKRTTDVLNFKLDIVHAQTPFSLGFLGKYVAKKQNIPLFYTHHTDFAGCIRAYIGDWFFIASLSEKITAFFANRCDFVIAPSKKMESHLLKAGVKTPVKILPTGTDLSRFKRTDISKKKVDELRNKYGISAEEKVLLTLSRIGKEKNIDLVISAFSEISKTNKNYKLVIVGKGPYLNELKSAVESSDIKNRVIFTGFVPDEEKPFYYQLGDIFVYGCLNDVQALVVLEAVASGLPVIIADDDAFYGMVENGVNGIFINPPTPKLFSAKTLEILTDGALRNRYSEGSLAIAEKYSENALAEKLVDLYQSAIQNKTGLNKL